MARRNPLEFASEFVLNLLDPPRQQFRRAQTLQGQRESARARSAASRQETVNVAGIEEANIRASSALAVERERVKQAQNKVLADIFSNTGLPINTRGLAGERLLGQGSIRRLPGLGPTAFDPANFNRQTALETAQGLQATGSGRKSLAEAGQIGDLRAALSPEDLRRDFLGLGATGVPTDFRLDPTGATRTLGGLAPEATPKPQATPLERLGFRLEQAKAERPTFAQTFTGQPVFDAAGERVRLKPGITPEASAEIDKQFDIDFGQESERTPTSDATFEAISELRGSSPETRTRLLQKMRSDEGRKLMESRGINVDTVIGLFF